MSIDVSAIAITVLLLFFTVFALSDLFMLCKRFNYAPVFKIKGSRLSKDGRLFEGGRLLNYSTFKVGAYSRVGVYSRVALIRSITVIPYFLLFNPISIGLFYGFLTNMR